MTSDDRFAACMKIELQFEGGFVNDPADSGGATNFGITQRVYDAYRRTLKSSTQSVRYIQAAEYMDIYHAQYWDAIRGDQLYAGLDLMMIDDAINSGPVKAIKDLQRALGVAADGQFGLHTLDALSGVKDKAGLIRSIYAIRVSFWRSLSNFWRFGAGWLNRGSIDVTDALAMLAGVPLRF